MIMSKKESVPGIPPGISTGLEFLQHENPHLAGLKGHPKRKQPLVGGLSVCLLLARLSSPKQVWQMDQENLFGTFGEKQPH